MTEVINVLKLAPGIIGGCLFHPQKGIVENNLPPDFDNSTISKFGSMLNKLMNACQKNFRSVSEVTFCYNDAVFLVREAPADTLLLLMCKPSEGMSDMVEVTIDDVLKKLEDYDFTVKTPFNKPVKKSDSIITVTDGDIFLEDSQEEENPQQRMGDPGPASNMSPEELMNFGPMSAALSGVENALVKVMGPMGKFLFQEGLEEWLASYHPSRETLPNLVTILNVEINDPEKIQQFNSYLDI